VNGNDEQQVKDKDILQTQLRRLVRATIVLYLALGLVGGYAYIQAVQGRAELEAATEQTTTALCTLRADLERRVEVSREFLEKNPDGIPGITAETIQQGIDNQQRTIGALASLNCG
jgi:uncharacterized protein (DUF1786 family)